MNKNVAVIGMGQWGKNLVRNFYQLGALRVVCDSDRSHSALIDEKYPGVEFRQDYASVLTDNAIQAVSIAAPAVNHYDMAMQALDAGKDVFVEKPLALDVDQCKQLISLAEKKQRILMVGHLLNYHPAVIRLKEIIKEGMLGNIQYIYSNRLNIGKLRTEENVLWSFAPHDISVILSILDEEPIEVSCAGGAWINPHITDITMSQFVFPSGVKAHIFVSWLHPFKEQRLVLIGSEKMAVFDDTIEEKLRVYPHRVEWKNRIPTAIKETPLVIELSDGEPLKRECSHFLECVKSRAVPLTDGHEGLRVLKVLDQCQKMLDDKTDHCDIPDIENTASKSNYYVHPTAVVDEPCEIGEGTKIWHFSHVMKGAKIGERCIFGQNVNIDRDTVIGNNVKVQNNVSIYTGVEIEDDVFLGPSCVLTNVTNPRSQVIRHSLYEKTLLKRGASIGANATIVCGITIGRYAFIAAGAVVAKDVPDYALMVGVPARQTGWISRHGLPLKNPNSEGILICPESGLRYKEVEPGVLKCLDIDEEKPLPEALSEGKVYYDSLVHQTK